MCFYLSLISVALPQVALSTPLNKTTADGKVFITGDHNEVVVSTAQETKKALAEIKTKLNSLNEKDEKFTERILSLENTVESLEKHMGKKFDLMNKSNAALSVQVQAMSQRLTTLEKQDYALLFTRKGTSDYVMTRGMPSLKAVTVCLWMKTADTGNEGTPLSYAVSGSDNEILLIDYRNFLLWVGGGHSGRTSVSTNDGKWHHICYAWENTAGSWKLYKDGKVAASGRGLNTGHVIRGRGFLVLGQEQDSEGGSFHATQSFIGEMTGVNIWDHVIKHQEIMRMSKSCLTGVGNVFQWHDFKAHVKGSVNIIKPSC